MGSVVPLLGLFKVETSLLGNKCRCGCSGISGNNIRPRKVNLRVVVERGRRACSDLEYVEAAVLVGTVQLSAVARHGDTVAVFILVVDGAASGIAVHSHVSPHLAVSCIS